MKTIVTVIASLLILLMNALAMAQEPVQVSTLALNDTLNASGGMSLGPDGNLYVADFFSRNYSFAASNVPFLGTDVYRVLPDGTVEVFATGFQGAAGNTFDAAGILYQTNVLSSTIEQITPDGMVSGYASSLSHPTDVVIDTYSDSYVTNCGIPASSSIIKITRFTSTLFSDSGLLRCALGITLDNDGNVYVSNLSDGNIVKFTPDAIPSLLATVPGDSGQLTFANDHLYVVARTDRRIYQVTLDGEVRVLAGSGAAGIEDGSAFEASFLRPFGIAASVTGDTLYVNDSGDITSSGLHPNAIRMITGVKAQTSPVANEDADEVPAGFFLAQNYPNPFNPETVIGFALPEATYVRLIVYDAMGREVTRLVDEPMVSGRHAVRWEAGGLPSGAYLYRLTAGAFTKARMMVLLR